MSSRERAPVGLADIAALACQSGLDAAIEDVLAPLRQAGRLATLPLLPARAADIIAASEAATKQAACPPLLFALLVRE